MRYPLQISRNIVMRPLLGLLGVRQADSFAEIDEVGLRVRMGRWFDATVPLSEISALGPSEWPLWGGFGVKLAPREGVGVVASTEGVVHLEFRRPQRMSVAIVSRDARRMWLSVTDRERVLADLAAATGLPVAPPVGFWKAR